MRKRSLAAIAVAVTAAIAAVPTQAAAERPSPPTRPTAHAALFAPRITPLLKNLAMRRATIVFGKRFATSSGRRVLKMATKVVLKWEKSKARQCPDPLPGWFFCSQPPSTHWGRGLALEINYRGPGEFRSPWRPGDPPLQTLTPGVVFWLTCWTPGATIDNHVYRSNLWYRLTNGLYVSDGWLDTGTNAPLTGVARC
jgi:hypothetical protein